MCCFSNICLKLKLKFFYAATVQKPDFLSCVCSPQVPAKPLLPQIKSKDAGKICVVIDLDETLVHSSFKVSWRDPTMLHPLTLFPLSMSTLMSTLPYHGTAVNRN